MKIYGWKLKKTGKKIIVGVIYRHPNYNFQEFQKCFTTTLLNFENAKLVVILYIICGDININLLSNSSNKRVATYIETLLSNGCNSLINNPTRFSFNSKPSLLDHIYTNNISNGKECGICLYDISDHLPVFVMIKNCKSIISNDIAAYTRSVLLKLFWFCSPLASISRFHSPLSHVMINSS